VIGSIVANQGFINQYGTVKDPKTGKLALNAQHIALWGAVYFVTCIAIQLVAPTTADRYGRKFNMWGITVFITTASFHIPKDTLIFANINSQSLSSASPRPGGKSSSHVQLLDWQEA
jgi:MFS family permease